MRRATSISTPPSARFRSFFDEAAMKIRDFPLLPSVPSGGYVIVSQPTGRDPNGDLLSVFAKVPATTLGTGGGGSGTLTLDDALMDDLGTDITRAAADDLGTVLINLATDDLPSGTSGGSTASDDNIINVRDHGAAADGVTDDTFAIQAALDAVPAAGGTVLLPGMCLISNTVFIKSLTRLTGVGPGSGLLAAASFPPNTNPPTGANSSGAMLCNKNYTATVLTDHDIVVENMTFDFGAHANALADHALRFYRTSNVVIDGVTFQVRGCGDATALIGCANVLTQACSAFDWSNCAFDHWWEPKNIRVIGCYGKSALSITQVVNFNPDHHPGSDPAGYVADTLVIADCDFDCSGSSISPGCSLEPLAGGATCKNIVVSGNTFKNTWLLLRGGISGAVVSGNTFLANRGNYPVVLTIPNGSGNPADFVVANNVIEDPNTTTATGFNAVLHLYCDRAVITGNRISGSLFTVAALDVGTNVATVVGNSFPAGATVLAPNAGSGILLQNGLHFGSNTVATPADLSKHLDLYNGQLGISVDASGSTNIVGSSTGVAVYANGTRSAVFNDQGIVGTNIGAVAPGTGSFVTLKVTSSFAAWGGTPPGAKPARPVTLADVINVLITYGMTA
jgi:hypothetical protein